MRSVKVILGGIVLILASLFFMGICIINVDGSGPELLTIILFVTGLIVSLIGLFFTND